MNDGLPAKRITGDTQDGIPAPKDDPTALDDYGTTAGEQQAGEPLDTRLAREQPDMGARANQPADESASAADPYPTDKDELTGRVVQPDEGARPDTEKDESGYDAGTDSGGYSAEERAVNARPEA